MVRVTVEKMTGEYIESLSCKSGRVSWVNCLTVLEIIYWQQPVGHLVFCSGKRDQMARRLYNVKCKENPMSKENYSSEQYFFQVGAVYVSGRENRPWNRKNICWDFTSVIHITPAHFGIPCWFSGVFFVESGLARRFDGNFTQNTASWCLSFTLLPGLYRAILSKTLTFFESPRAYIEMLWKPAEPKRSLTMFNNNAHTYTRIYIQTHMYIHTYLHTHTHIYIYTHTCIYIYTETIYDIWSRFSSTALPNPHPMKWKHF